MRPGVEIGGRQVGDGHPCFVIAEAGVNHDGSIDDAMALVDAAADAGADAVKFQTFKTESLAAPWAPKAEYQVAATGSEESQVAMLRRLEFAPDAHPVLLKRATERGLVFLSSAFDSESALMLVSLGVPAIKLGSGEVTNGDLLSFVGGLGKPVILSTGMSTLKEIETAVGILAGAGNKERVLLHCVSAYPAPIDEANLRAMTTMRKRFDAPIGFSDHTLGSSAPLAAVALGANVIEKHLTLDSSRSGPDHRASMEPSALAALIRAIREVESALGDGVKGPARSEADVARVARRSLTAVHGIPRGSIIEDDMLVALRPGTGLSPLHRATVVGRRAARDIPAGIPLTEKDLA